MAEGESNKAGLIATLAVIGHLLAIGVATACLWQMGNWEQHGFGLTLTLRILWGVWIVHLLATILTRVTIFGWNFRRYFRPSENEGPPKPPLRPIKAPWYKSGTVSFTITVVLVSLTGACAIATAVLYILEDVIGDWVFWLVCMIIWVSWWVLSIATVLTRLAIFGAAKYKAVPVHPGRQLATSAHDTSENGS